MDRVEENNLELIDLHEKYPQLEEWLTLEELYDDYLGARITHVEGGFECEYSQKFTAPTDLAKMMGFYTPEWQEQKDIYEYNILNFLKQIYESYRPYIFFEDEDCEVHFFKADSLDDFIDKCTKSVKFYYELDNAHRGFLKDDFDKFFLGTDVSFFYIAAKDMPLIIRVHGIEFYGYSKREDEIKPIQEMAYANNMFIEQEEL